MRAAGYLALCLAGIGTVFLLMAFFPLAVIPLALIAGVKIKKNQ